MNHEIVSFEGLYGTASDLYNKYAIGYDSGSLGAVRSDINKALQFVQSEWGGNDALVQIHNIVVAYNDVVKVSNLLSVLARDIAAVPVLYRDKQISNGVVAEPLAPLSITDVPTLSEDEEKLKVNMSSDLHLTATVAQNGRTAFATALSSVDTAKKAIDGMFDLVKENWKSGPGLTEAANSFAEYSNILNNEVKPCIEEVLTQFNNALSNYDL